MELAKAEEKVIQMKKEELERNGIQEGPEFDALKRAEEGRRKIYYTWPSFCRDLVSLLVHLRFVEVVLIVPALP